MSSLTGSRICPGTIFPAALSNGASFPPKALSTQNLKVDRCPSCTSSHFQIILSFRNTQLWISGHQRVHSLCQFVAVIYRPCTTAQSWWHQPLSHCHSLSFQYSSSFLLFFFISWFLLIGDCEGEPWWKTTCATNPWRIIITNNLSLILITSDSLHNLHPHCSSSLPLLSQPQQCFDSTRPYQLMVLQSYQFLSSSLMFSLPFLQMLDSQSSWLFSCFPILLEQKLKSTILHIVRVMDS